MSVPDEKGLYFSIYSFLSHFLEKAKKLKIVAFCGAGISAPSGVPTFRGRPDSLWARYRPEDLANINALLSKPDLVWSWYKWRLELIFEKHPNSAHYILSDLEREKILIGIITQNVDPYHEWAGNRTVIHLHGSIVQARCLECESLVHWKEPPKEIPPRCFNCGGLLRPNVVFFGEMLPPRALEEANFLLQEANLMLVIGTSGVVYPAAGYVPAFRKLSSQNRIMEFNLESTPLTPTCDLSVLGDVSKTLPIFKQALDGVLSDKNPN